MNFITTSAPFYCAYIYYDKIFSYFSVGTPLQCGKQIECFRVTANEEEEAEEQKMEVKT